jgi:hypothetical protein
MNTELTLATQRVLHPSWLYLFLTSQERINNNAITKICEGVLEAKTLIIIRPLLKDQDPQDFKISILKVITYNDKVDVFIYQANSKAAIEKVKYIASGSVIDSKVIEVMTIFHQDNTYSLEYVESLVIKKLSELPKLELLYYDTTQYIPIYSPDNNFIIGVDAPREKAVLITSLLYATIQLLRREVRKDLPLTTDLFLLPLTTDLFATDRISDLHCHGFNHKLLPFINQSIQLSYLHGDHCELGIYFSVVSHLNKEIMPSNDKDVGMKYHMIGFRYDFKTKEKQVIVPLTNSPRVNLISTFWGKILSCLFPFVIYKVSAYVETNPLFCTQILYSTDDLMLINKTCLNHVPKNNHPSIVNSLNTFMAQSVENDDLSSIEELREKLLDLYQRIGGLENLEDLM